MRKRRSACTLMRISRVQINIILIVLSSSKEAVKKFHTYMLCAMDFFIPCPCHIHTHFFFFVDNFTKLNFLQLNDAMASRVRQLPVTKKIKQQKVSCRELSLSFSFCSSAYWLTHSSALPKYHQNNVNRERKWNLQANLLQTNSMQIPDGYVFIGVG